MSKLKHNYLLNLLFNFRGSISRKEYLTGLLTLLLGLVVSFLLVSHQSFLWTSSEELTNFANQISPNNLFLRLIIVYSSFILTLKRGRNLHLNKYFSYFVPTVISLFIHTMMQDIFDRGDLSSWKSGFILFGFLLLVILYLSEWKNERELKFEYQDRKQVRYLVHIFLIHGIIAVMASISFQRVINQNFFQELFLTIFIALLVVFYLLVIFRRITDINLNIRVFFFLLLGTILYEVGWVFMNKQLFFTSNFDSSFYVNIVDCIFYSFSLIISIFILFMPTEPQLEYC